MLHELDAWNKEKKSLAAGGYETLPFRERQVWWCAVGSNLGVEINGKNDFSERPAVVIKRFNNMMAWVVPMTTKRGPDRYHFEICLGGKISFVVLSQIRAVSVKRFMRIIGTISEADFIEIKKRLKNLLE
jgi:mRNA interferase MazF